MPGDHHRRHQHQRRLRAGTKLVSK
jgi:hypothetical protein